MHVSEVKQTHADYLRTVPSCFIGGEEDFASPLLPARSFLGFPGLLGFPGSLCFRGAGGLGDGLLADGFSPREFDSRSRPSALMVSPVFPVLLVFLVLFVFAVLFLCFA